MGAQPSSSRPPHGFSVSADHQELLGEYIHHVRATVDECASNFRGSSRADDDDCGGTMELREDMAGDKEREMSGGEEDSLQRQLRQLRLRIGSKHSAYPRKVQLPQFDEIFGMLVADTEQHFHFFQASNSPPTVVAHQVFCCAALLMRADLRDKMDFILRLYADPAGRLTPESKRMLLSDMAASIARLSGTSETLSRDSNITIHFEKTIFSDSPQKLGTVRDVFDACFTDAQISSVLLDISASIQEFIDSLHQHNKNQPLSFQTKRGQSMLGQLSPKRASTKLLQPLLQSSILWEMRSGDFPFFWRKQSPRVFSGKSTTFEQALADIAQDNAFVLVSHEPSTSMLTTVTINDFLEYYLHTFQNLATDVASGAIQRDQRLQRHSQIERAVREVSGVSLSEVVGTVRGNTQHPTFLSRLCVDEDLPFFHVVLLLASGKRAVSVLPSLCYQDTHHIDDKSGYPSVNVLGSIDEIDVLEWIELDSSVLKDKYLLHLSAFHEIFYAPACVSELSMTFSDALADMARLHVSGIRVHDSKLLSVEAFRDSFLTTRKQIIDGADGLPLYPQLTNLMRDGIASSAAVMNSALAEYISLPPNASLARAIRVMVEHRTRRVLIRRSSDNKGIGVIRATDVLKILLREQHVSYR